MRDIKFRGKNNNGKWIYGTGVVQVEHNTYDTDKWELVQKVNYDELDYFIPSYETEEIDINTIGQYTKLKDKNGKEIYEGDIVKIAEKNNIAKHKVIQMKPIVADIEWSEEYLAYILITFSVKDAFENLADYLEEYDIEVIGNIYDNPELLKEE